LNSIVRYADVDPGTLLPNPQNWRQHPQPQLAALSGSITELGWIAPVIVNLTTQHVVDGHARISEAVRHREPTIPVAYVELTEAQERLALASFDPITAMATTDQAMLNDLLDGLTTDDGGLSDLLASLVVPPPKPLNEDDADLTPPAEPITKPGNLWIMGEHRLLCGDATKREDVEWLLAGARPNLMVTDPPYGVNYDPKWRNEAAAKGLLAYAARRVGEVPNDDRSDWADAWRLFPGDVVYSWHPAGAPSLVHAAALQDSGFTIRMQIIWAKSNFPIGRGDYHVRHEPCWYAIRNGKPAHRTNDRTQTTLWEINLDRNVEGGHSTQKPVECMQRPMRNHEPCDVYDPFVGSGTSIVAAEREGRRCYALDIDPGYCDVSVRRWEHLTGHTATLAKP
jgi:DNA modification methylase